MAFTRETIVDSSPTGDSVKQAVLDLDTDLTAAFIHLNTLLTGLGNKLDATQKGAANGVATLDENGLLTRTQFPSSELPVGTIMAIGSEELPDGSSLLECDGAELATADYPLLFGVIGFTFGGTGAAFNLPDLRGAFIRGWDHAAENDPNATDRTGGDHVGSTQECEVQAHTHLQRDGYSSAATGGTVAYSHRDGSPKWETAKSGGDETRPANIALMYCIKWR